MQIAFVQIYPFEQNSLWASKGEVKELSKDLIDCFKILEGEPGDKIYLPLIPSYRFIYSFETLQNLRMVLNVREQYKLYFKILFNNLNF